jgi:hypothetical protein
MSKSARAKASKSQRLRDQKNRPLYRLAVRPGILSDGTFGVYAVPLENPEVEYQLDARFKAADDAVRAAHEYFEAAPDRFGSAHVNLESERHLDLPSSYDKSEKMKDFNAAALKGYYKAGFAKLSWPKSLKGALLHRLMSPYGLAIGAMLLFWRSWSISIPSETPIIGELAANAHLDKLIVARLLPLVFFILSVGRVIRELARGVHNSAIREQVLALVFGGGWRAKDFWLQVGNVASEEGFGWIMRLGDVIKDKHQTLSAEFVGKVVPQGHAGHQDATEQLQHFLEEDFEARVHALLFMRKERNFQPWLLVLPPVEYLLDFERAKERLNTYEKEGRTKFLRLPLEALPGWEQSHMLKFLFPVLMLPSLLLLLSSAIWASILVPWPGPWRYTQWVIPLLIVLPILVWNFEVGVSRRGLPAGTTLKEFGHPPPFRLL